MKVKELLKDESKWRKGYGHPPERCCLYVAMIYCGFSSASEVYARVKRRIGGIDIAGWNDAHERVFAEVKALVEELDI